MARRFSPPTLAAMPWVVYDTDGWVRTVHGDERAAMRRDLIGRRADDDVNAAWWRFARRNWGL